ncbi:MAG TPA: hypothetical protein VGB36_02765 [Gammaproteobacteria bacterium]|jgi:hypothetical protein
MDRLSGASWLDRVGVNSVTAASAELTTIEEARSWIGRRLILRKPLLGFDPGTHCVVMCVIDFGDELLLWITTDDKRAEEVDQMNPGDIRTFFQVLPAGSEQRPARGLPGVTGISGS